MGIVIVVVAPGQGSQSPGFLTPWLDVDGARDRLAAYSDWSGVDLIAAGTEWDAERITCFVEGLRLFRLGFSWGGTHSLVMAYPPLPRMQRGYEGRVVRLNVGLEEPADLIADLRHSLSRVS